MSNATDAATVSLFLESAFKAAVKTAEEKVRNEWQQAENVCVEQAERARRGIADAYAELHKFKRERDNVNARIRLQEVRSTETFNLLLATFPDMPADIVRRASEGIGDFMPPSCRRLLGEQHDAAGSLLSPAPPPASELAQNTSCNSPVSDDSGVQTRDGNIAVSSASPRRDTPSTKRPAQSPCDTSALRVNKRARASNTSQLSSPSTEHVADRRPSQEASSIEPSPPTQRYRGTVVLDQIDGLRTAFRSPETGPGFYVLLCSEPDDILTEDDDRNGIIYDPWKRNRARSHYTKARDCHGEPFPDIHVTDAMIIQRYGYLVEDMTEAAFLKNNQLIEDRRQMKLSREKMQKRNASKSTKSEAAATSNPAQEIRTIQRNPSSAGGPAPVPDMGLSVSCYAQASVEDEMQPHDTVSISGLEVPSQVLSYSELNEYLDCHIEE